MNDTFEILICAYGDYTYLIKRCINSILKNSTIINKIHVGLNNCNLKTKYYLRDLLDQKIISTLIESNSNINKDPMMRLLLDLVETPYMIWFDDDSYINKKNWDMELISDINQKQADILGFPHVVGYDEFYINFLKSRSWYKNKTKNHESNICFFPVGGVWVAKCEYLRKYSYPDRDMIKRNDDMLLGDLLFQTDGKFQTLNGWDSTFMVNKADRRGDGEKGWKNFI